VQPASSEHENENAAAPTQRPAQPAGAGETMPRAIAERPPQGAIGALIGRLFGGESTTAPGPTPIAMPWARRSPRQPANEPGEPSGESPVSLTQPSRPQPSPVQPAVQTPPIPVGSQIAPSSPPQPPAAQVATTSQAGEVAPEPEQAEIT